MTKYDIRVRRENYTLRNIEKHKNYQRLLHTHRKRKRLKNLGLIGLMMGMVVVIFILILLIKY